MKAFLIVNDVIDTLGGIEALAAQAVVEHGSGNNEGNANPDFRRPLIIFLSFKNSPLALMPLSAPRVPSR